MIEALTYMVYGVAGLGCLCLLYVVKGIYSADSFR